MGFGEPQKKLRWPRAHRFSLSEHGRAAELEYRERIVSSRLNAGRASFDSARAQWATSYRVQADDGLYLCELADGKATLSQLLIALESCGQSRPEVLAALARLDDAGMFDNSEKSP